MKLSSILVANRAEIAIRIVRACGDLGLSATTVYSEDDVESCLLYTSDAADE